MGCEHARTVRARAATHGPRYHWFGYYDMPCWDRSGRWLVSLGVDFEQRAPTGDDLAIITLTDLHGGSQTELGATHAFNWQQGAMLNWLVAAPGRRLLYNDRVGSRFMAVVLDVDTGRHEVVGPAVSDVALGGDIALGLNFARIAQTRPGYGYAGLADPFAAEDHPDGDGVTALDLSSGRSQLIVSMRQVYELLHDRGLDGCKLWFNHTLLNPSGQRLAFLARWQPRGETGWRTVMLTAKRDGSGLKALLTDGMVSHFDWRNERELLVWTRIGAHGAHFYLIDEPTGAWTIVGERTLTQDGHCSYSHDGRWIVTDTYPDSQTYRRTLLLHDPQTGCERELGQYLSPSPFVGEIRCDLHPRWSWDDRWICFDSVHEGHRQVYVVPVDPTDGT